tara:strand:+ start:175 stop:300 length:126 start_codon:yes stop_codon:yes gene_type:complete
MIKKIFKNKKLWVPGFLISLFLFIVIFLSKFKFSALGYTIF